MGNERDLLFTGDFLLSVWAEAARETGSTRAVEPDRKRGDRRDLEFYVRAIAHLGDISTAPPTLPRNNRHLARLLSPRQFLQARRACAVHTRLAVTEPSETPSPFFDQDFTVCLIG